MPCQISQNRSQKPESVLTSVLPARTAGRCEMRWCHRFIQLFLRTLCSALVLGILPKPNGAKVSTVRARKRRREAGRSSQPPGDSFCTAPDASEAKPCSAATAHKGPNTAFHSLGGVIDATQSTGVAQTVSKGLTWGFLFSGYVSEGTLRLLAEKNLPEIYQPHFTSSKHFENFLLWTESVSLITAG